MGRTVTGAELSTYKTIAIELGKSKVNRLNNGKEASRYVRFTVKNKKSRLCKAGHLMIFEEDDPELIEGLKAYAAQQPNKDGLWPVDMSALKDADADLWDDIGHWDGLQPFQYKLRKGLCYLNDADDNRVNSAITGEPVMKDVITILVQVDYMIENNGTFDVTYIQGMDPNTIGSRMENSRYRHAVTSTPTTPAVEVEDAEITEDQVF